MALAEQGNDRQIENDLPANRQYKSAANQALDNALTECILRAEDAENEYLTTVLRNELKSLYYGTR